MSGAVEVLKPPECDPSDSSGCNQSASAEHSFTIDIDESLTLDCSALHGGALIAPGAVNGRLHIDRAKVRGSVFAGFDRARPGLGL